MQTFPRSLAPFRAAVLATLLTLPSGPAGAVAAGPGDPAGPPSIVLTPDGNLRRWEPGRTALGPVPSAGGSGGPLQDLARLDANRYLVLLPAGSGGTGRRGGRMGRVEVFSEGGPGNPQAPPVRIDFEGDGLRLAVGPGGRAFVLARRREGDRPDGGQHWVHQIDLATARVAMSCALPGPAAALLVSPRGDRLFVGMRDRILTLSTGRRLAASWHYRSPGSNLGLAFRPGTEVLFAGRGPEVAVFDPERIAARQEGDRRTLDDDATARIPLPFPVSAFLFAPGGRIAAAYGAGTGLAFIDTGLTALAGSPHQEPAEGVERILPIGFIGEDRLALASFPGEVVTALTLPGLPPAAPPIMPAPVPSPELPADNPSPGSEAPASPPEPTPVMVPAPAPRPASEAVLRGRIEGDLSLVEAVVVYGPDSIVREQARIIPAADGTWQAPLPPPGNFRIVLRAKGAAPLRVAPNFHTVQVAGAGIEGIDFRVGAPGP